MAVYELKKRNLSNGLDEVGLFLSLNRLPGEDLDTYRRRLLFEVRSPSGASDVEYRSSLSRHLGLFDKKVLSIGLVMSGSSPLAEDPFIEVTSTKLRAFRDRNNSVVDFEIDLNDLENGRFLKHVQSMFDNSSYYEVVFSEDNIDYLESNMLMLKNSDGFVNNELVLTSGSYKLENSLIKSLYTNSFNSLINEKNNASEVELSGDFYLDKNKGVIFTNSTDRFYVTYSYYNFPFDLFWQSVRAYNFNDKDVESILKDELVEDSTGELAPLLLNSRGANMYNELLITHPLGWGR